MPHLIFAIISWGVLLITVGKTRIIQLSVNGVIGVALAITVDSFGRILGLYKYANMIFPIAGYIPISHLFYIYASTILYLNWLPGSWLRRLIYTACFSAAFLVVEAIMYQAGAIIYLKWRLWYSFFLVFSGLSVIGIITDKLRIKNYLQSK